MAVVSHLHAPKVVDLRRIRVSELEPILEQEIADWQQQLDWDYHPSAELVRRFVGMQALNGCALVEGGVLAGYSYFVREEHKGLIGDLYLAAKHRTVENENRLLKAVLDSLMKTPRLARIESQLMMLEEAWRRPIPASEFLTIHRRNFMAIEKKLARGLTAGRAKGRVVIERWQESRQESAAQLIAAAYEGHVDGEINEQYRSVAGARRFLTNIIQYPGCGTFFQPASYLAVDPGPRRPCGVSLASLLSRDVGHITQICVAPEYKSKGIGYELLRHSLASLMSFGCRKVSLTVTSGNTEAVRLYERVGFETVRMFAAMVWEGF